MHRSIIYLFLSWSNTHIAVVVATLYECFYKEPAYKKKNKCKTLSPKKCLRLRVQINWRGRFTLVLFFGIQLLMRINLKLLRKIVNNLVVVHIEIENE